jgi:hypothetical protein
MDMVYDNFPLGIATGNAFCNRKQEIARLDRNIKSATPTLITAPRRFGKTSLAMRVLGTCGIPYAMIDLFHCATEQDILDEVANGFCSLIDKIETKPEKALRLAREFFSDSRLEVSIRNGSLSLSINRKEKELSDTLRDIIKQFEAMIEKKQKKVVFFIDEFQIVTQFSASFSIEATLRYFVQKSKNICFLFSGSNRHLLSKIFDDSKRPFYGLCDRIVLEKISRESYKPYVQEKLGETWGSSLTTDIVDRILDDSECHPYYVNLLCRRLSVVTDLQSPFVVTNCWDTIAREHRSLFANEIDLMSTNQRRLLIGIAKSGSVESPMGPIFSGKIGISTPSIRQALLVLEQRDYVFKASDGSFNILDPLLKRVLQIDLNK